MQKNTKIEMSQNETYFVVIVGEYGQVDVTFGRGRGIELMARLKPGEEFSSHAFVADLHKRPKSLSDNWLRAIDDSIQKARSFNS